MPHSDEINDAITRLQLTDAEIRRLSDSDSNAVRSDIAGVFVTSRSSWEVLREPNVAVWFADGTGWSVIARIVPDPVGPAWFVVPESVRTAWSIYDTSPSVAQSILGECGGFEYYVVSASLDWLVFENHHSFVVAIGESVEERLRNIGAELSHAAERAQRKLDCDP